MENNEENNQIPKLKFTKKRSKSFYQQQAEIQQELSAANKFIEYFFIIGLDPKLSIEDYLYNSSFDDLQIFYSKDLKPQIITKFPPINKSYINIDDNLCELCFPNGLKLVKFDYKPEPEVLKFILGNSYYSIDYPLKYITCLKIYENLKSYQNLQLKLKDALGNNFSHVRQKSIAIRGSLKKDKLNSRKSISSSKDLKNYLISDNNAKIKKRDFNKYYFPKIIGFASLKPFYKYQEQILFQIYNLYKNNSKIKIPLEKNILNILHNIPMPPKGLNIYEYKISENFEKIRIKAEKMNKLKNIDDDLAIIFQYFSIDNFIEIFKYTLYETKTLIFGTNVNHLCSFVYGLISLIYPFTYPFQISSSVHNNAFEILESIPPYIIGINKKYTDDFFQKNKIEIKGSNYIIIDLDGKEFSLAIVEDVPNIPKYLSKKLRIKLDNNLKKYKKSKVEKNKTNDNNKEDENVENWICFAFFDFFLNIMNNYKDYLCNDNFKKNYKISSLKNLFKLRDFIDSHSSNDRPFYKKFCGTQMFNDFIFKKMIPKNIDEKLEILFFDEYINKKNNKKFFSKNKPVFYLNSKEYEYKDIYQIPILNGLSIKERERYNDKNYILNSLLLGQEIIFIQDKINNIKLEKNSTDNFNKDNNNNDVYKDKNNNIINKNIKEKEENGNCYFNYILFPKFNKDFFNFPSPEYALYTPITSDIKRINTELLARSHITPGEITENYDGMLDYIYLTYIEVWGYSYWYQDIIERDFRFNQMLEVLDKIKYQEIELINVLFESLNKFEEKEKIIKLYNKILAYNITPNNYIYSIVGKIAKKSSENYGDMQKKKCKEKHNFARRTFKTENETNNLKDSISFNNIQHCPECNKLIDIERISRDYKKIKKDLYWAKCPYCNYIKPEVSIYFGNTISSKYLNIPFSKVETFTLYSPYELKNSIKDIIDKEKLHLLDIDKFKMKFPNLFWSCIWFFHLYNLDYNIVLPYEENIFNKKTNSSEIDLNTDNKLSKNLKKYNNIINLNRSINNNNNKNFIQHKPLIQNVYSFSFINSICHDYFGIFNKFKKEEHESFNRSQNRKKTFVKGMNKSTISGFLKSGGNKRLSDKNIININKLFQIQSIYIGSPNIKSQNFKNNDIYQIDEINFGKQLSEDISNIRNSNDLLNEINQIKPIKILCRPSINEKDNESQKSRNSSSSNEDKSFD